MLVSCEVRAVPEQELSRIAVFRRMEAAVEQITRLLDRHKYLLLGLYSVAYFWATCYRASRKLFWFDEVVTMYVSRLPDLKAIWGATLTGVDFSSPLMYMLTRWSLNVVPVEEIGARLPATIGFWIFTLCLFRFVSVRSNTLAGLISLLFPLATRAYFYAYEARAYGILLACCGLAVVSWQYAAEHYGSRIWSLIGIFVGLAGGLLIHPTALLMFGPLLLGEMARFAVSRRSDWALWLGNPRSVVADSCVDLFWCGR